MSNRIDFFQSAQTQLALPASTVSVFLEGSLCPILEVVEIVRSDWPEFSRARFSYNPAAHPDVSLTDTEKIEAELAIGKPICIHLVYNGAAPGSAAFGFPIFEGQIENIETRLEDDGERVEITAKDSSANLKRITVYGQRAGGSDGSTLFLSGVDTIFNPNGKANAAADLIENNGHSYRVFSDKPSQAKLWSYAEAIEYLLCEYLSNGQLQRPRIEQLQSLTEKQIVRDLDVTGSNLLEALHRCCDRTGLRFKFVPRSESSGPRQAIVFYRPGRGRTVELNCQQAGEQFSISKTNILKLHSRKNFYPITHKYIGQGDFKVYEATFDLVKGWDAADEDNDYDKFSPSTNPDFYRVKDVYRKWCLNEAGDYSGSPYNQGEAFDFSRIFEGGNFTRRRRRFRPTLSTDKKGRSLGYFLQVSFDNGLHWWQYLYAFNNLLDECGVWLSSDQLDVDTWVAALKGVLKFRITASVTSNERLNCAIADGAVDSTAPVVEHIITLARQFKYRKVSSQSIFSNDETLGAADEADDSTALYEFVCKRARAASETIETADVQTPYLAFD